MSVFNSVMLEKQDETVTCVQTLNLEAKLISRNFDRCTSRPAKDQLEDTWSEVCSCLTYLTCKILSWTCADRDMLGGISQATGSLWKEKRFCWYGNTVDTVVFVFPSPHLSLSLSTSSSPSDDYHFWIIFYGSLSIYSAGLQRQKQRGGGRMDEKTGETLREAAGSIPYLGEWKDVFN